MQNWSILVHDIRNSYTQQLIRAASMVYRQQAPAAKVKFANLTNYNLINPWKQDVYKSLKFGGLGRDWHLEHGHKKCKVQLLAGLKLVMKWFNTKVLSCLVIVRLMTSTGRMFHKRGILLKYECLEYYWHYRSVVIYVLWQVVKSQNKSDRCSC